MDTARGDRRQPMPPTLIPTLRALVHRLVNGDYAGVEADGLIRRDPDSGELTTAAEEIERVLVQYGAALVDSPDEAFATAETFETGDDMHAYRVTIDLLTAPTFEAQPPDGGCTIECDLWTAEEGRSDLVLHAWIYADPDRPVQIDHIHGFPRQLISPLQELVHQLAIGNFAGLQAAERLGNYDAALVGRVLAEYEGIDDWHLTDLDVGDFKYADAWLLQDGAWAVDVDIAGWGLTMHAFVRPTPTGWVAFFQDIEVM